MPSYPEPTKATFFKQLKSVARRVKPEPKTSAQEVPQKAEHPTKKPK